MTAARSAPAVRFAVPETFRPIDLGPDPAARAEELLTVSDGLDADRRIGLVVAQEMLVSGLREGGVCYAAHVVGRVEGVRPRMSVGLFSVVVQAVRTGSDTILDEFATRFDSGGPGRTARTIPLPAGRALTIMEDRVIGSATGVGGHSHVVRQAQMTLPMPGRRHLVTFALATEWLQDWPTYLDILGDLARSITFDAPVDAPASTTGTISAALDGGVVHG